MEKPLIELYPSFLHCKTMEEILKQEEIILTEEENDISNLVKEFFIGSATNSLAIWAKFAGIEDNENLDIGMRRSNIKAALKAKDITTLQVIKNVVESYTNGRCEIIENYKDYSFKIKFVSSVGVPSRIEEIKRIINKLKPAHLDYLFEFRYRTHGDIKKTGKTCGYFKEKRLTCRYLREKEVI